MRSLRDLAAYSALWAVVALVVQESLLTSNGVQVSYVTGGLAAGLLIVVDPRRWWTVLAPLAAATAWGYRTGDSPPPVTVARTLSDVAAIVVYALIVRARPYRGTGLGAQIRVVTAAIVAATLLRLIPVVTHAAIGGDPMALRFEERWPVLVLATVSGLLAGSAIVIGLSRWREIAPTPADRWRCLGIAGANVAVLSTVFWAPSDTGSFGGEYIVLPLLLWAAIACPAPFAAVLSGTTVTMMAISGARQIGVYAVEDPGQVDQIVDLQALLVLIMLATALLVDVIGRQRAAEALALASATDLQAVYQDAPVAAARVVVDADGPLRVTEGNARFVEMFRLTEQPAGRPLHEVIGADREIEADGAGGAALSARRADGTQVWVRASVSLLRSGDGTRASTRRVGRAAVVVLEDVTAARTFTELQRRQLRRDALTGLPTREVLMELVDRPVDPALPVGVVVLNVNAMGEINEAAGHGAGDEVLITVAERLMEILEPEDVVARFTGDDFAIVRHGVTDGPAVAELARELVERLDLSVSVGDLALTLTMSAGSAYCSAHGLTERDVLRLADAGLTEAKRAGRGSLRHADLTPDSAVGSGRLDIEVALRHALDERLVQCAFQAVVDGRTRRTVSVEALARVPDRSGGLLPPALFIPLATELGLLGKLTELVLAIACRQARAWADAGTPLRVAINVPPAWISPESERLILRELDQHGLSGEALTLEITEDQTLDVTGPALEILRRLNAQGIRIAIDDFGTGYAGLSTFLDIPAEIVKVDRSFVVGMLRSPEGHDLVESIIGLAHRFDKVVVAEGVETEEQLQALLALKCDLIQGYLTGRPYPADQINLSSGHPSTQGVSVPASTGHAHPGR